MISVDKIGYVEIETNVFELTKQKAVNSLKKQIIEEVKKYCKMLNNGYQDFCYQDTLNKILFVELEKDLNNINLIFN